MTGGIPKIYQNNPSLPISCNNCLKSPASRSFQLILLWFFLDVYFGEMHQQAPLCITGLFLKDFPGRTSESHVERGNIRGVLCGEVFDFLAFLLSQTPNLKFGGSISACHHLGQFGFPPLIIAYTGIKGQLLSYHVYEVSEIKNPWVSVKV